MENNEIDRQLGELWKKVSGKEYVPDQAPSAPRFSEAQAETVQYLRNSFSKTEEEWKRLLAAKDSAIRDLGVQLDELRAHLGEMKQHYQEARERMINEEQASALGLEESGRILELQKKNHARELLLLKELLERSKAELSSLSGRLDALRAERDEWRVKFNASGAEKADLKDAADALEKKLGDSKEAVERTLAELLSERRVRREAEEKIKESEKKAAELQARLDDARAVWEAERKEWRELWDRERSVWETHRQEFSIWESRLRAEREAWTAKLKEEEGKGLEYAAGLANTLKESSQWSEKVTQILKLYALKGVQLPQVFVSADAPSASPARIGRGLARTAAAALAGLLLMGAAAWRIQAYRSLVHLEPLDRRSLEVPGAAGISVSEEGVWLAGWDKGLLLKDAKDLSTLRLYAAAPGEPFKPVSVSAFAGGIWILDMAQLRFIRKNPDSGKTVESVKTPGPAPQGTAWDGYNLWSFDAATALLYRYGIDPAAGVEASFELPGLTAVSAMQWSGRQLWVLDAGGRLKRFSFAEGKFREISSQKLGKPAASFWVRGGYFWTLEKNAAGTGMELARYKLKIFG